MAKNGYPKASFLKDVSNLVIRVMMLNIMSSVARFISADIELRKIPLNTVMVDLRRRDFDKYIENLANDIIKRVFEELRATTALLRTVNITNLVKTHLIGEFHFVSEIGTMSTCIAKKIRDAHQAQMLVPFWKSHLDEYLLEELSTARQMVSNQKVQWNEWDQVPCQRDRLPSSTMILNPKNNRESNQQGAMVSYRREQWHSEPFSAMVPHEMDQFRQEIYPTMDPIQRQRQEQNMYGSIVAYRTNHYVSGPYHMMSRFPRDPRGQTPRISYRGAQESETGMIPYQRDPGPYEKKIPYQMEQMNLASMVTDLTRRVNSILIPIMSLGIATDVLESQLVNGMDPQQLMPMLSEGKFDKMITDAAVIQSEQLIEHMQTSSMFKKILPQTKTQLFAELAVVAGKNFTILLPGLPKIELFKYWTNDQYEQGYIETYQLFCSKRLNKIKRQWSMRSNLNNKLMNDLQDLAFQQLKAKVIEKLGNELMSNNEHDLNS